MSKLLRLFSFEAAARSSRAHRLLNRALLFVGGLLILWVLLQLMPVPAVPSSSPAHSDEAGTGVVHPHPDSPGAEPLPLITPGRVTALFLLLGGGVLALWLRRQASGGTSANVPLRSLGQLPISPNQQLRLVACHDDVLLLGITAQAITVLKRYPQDAFDTPAAPAENSTASAPPFADLLRHVPGARVNGHT